MVQILPKIPTFGEQIARGLGSMSGDIASGLTEGILQKKQNQQQMAQLQHQLNQENEALKKMGLDLSGIEDPKLRQMMVMENLKGQTTQKKLDMEQLQKQQPLHAGLQTIDEMRKIRKAGNLGPKIAQGLGFGLISGDVRRDRSQYEQLGKSLISLASNIPIRNQQEFKVLADRIYDPTLTDAEGEGILNAMEHILQRSLGEKSEEKPRINKSETSENKEKKSSLRRIWGLA